MNNETEPIKAPEILSVESDRAILEKAILESALQISHLMDLVLLCDPNAKLKSSEDCLVSLKRAQGILDKITT